MRIELKRTTQKEKAPAHAFYVSQDNYELVDLDYSEVAWKYFYCDTAASRIIVIVSGKNKAGRRCVAIASLSTVERFETFGQIVENHFSGRISVFAHVANLPLHRKNTSRKEYLVSVRDVSTINRWVSQHTAAKAQEVFDTGLSVERATLLLGENGAANSEEMDCYGVDISAGIPVVSNRNFNLSMMDRDPSGGLQSLFCSWGTRLDPPMLLVRASSVFDPCDGASLISNQKRLLDIAHCHDYEKYEGYSDDEILEECSSLPYYESPWFCDAVRDASRFVRLNYNKAAVG